MSQLLVTLIFTMVIIVLHLHHDVIVCSIKVTLDAMSHPSVACRRVARSEPYRLTGAAAPLAIHSKEHGRQPGAFIAGFVKGEGSTPPPLFPPPKVPASYQPVHKFTEPLRTGQTRTVVFCKSAMLIDVNA